MVVGSENWSLFSEIDFPPVFEARISEIETLPCNFTPIFHQAFPTLIFNGNRHISRLSLFPGGLSSGPGLGMSMIAVCTLEFSKG